MAMSILYPSIRISKQPVPRKGFGFGVLGPLGPWPNWALAHLGPGPLGPWPTWARAHLDPGPLGPRAHLGPGPSGHKAPRFQGNRVFMYDFPEGPIHPT